METTKWLSVVEVAERLGVARTTVYALCNKQRISHIRVGVGEGAIRISEESLNDYIHSSTVAAEGGRGEQGE